MDGSAVSRIITAVKYWKAGEGFPLSHRSTSSVRISKREWERVPSKWVFGMTFPTKL
jgi:hypothetical protein